MTLPAALMPLSTGMWQRNFIPYRLQPSLVRPGKMDKIPVDWRTGIDCDAHNRGNWCDYWTAYLVADGQVGFVLSDDDPFWVIDVDNCLMPDNTWSPVAQDLLRMLPGCGVEVSVSGRGLHIFGVGQVPQHKCTNKALGLEMYHRARFIALGKHPELAQGNAMTDSTAALAAVVAKYFAQSDAPAPNALWTDKPCEGWRGPEDDTELLRRALNSKSANSAFGTRASFAQLWNADATALRAAYPDPARDYDESSADRALAQHLAFWTGKDCSRIARLMGQSKLKRDKWDREDYVRRTVLSAVAQQRDVLQDKPAETAVHAVSSTPIEVQGDTYLNPDAQRMIFEGCVYIMDRHEIFLPNGLMLDMGRFNAMFGGYSYVIDRVQGKIAKTPWDAFHNSRDIKWPHVHAASFEPWRAPGQVWEEAGRRYVNTYTPIKTARTKGDPEPFLAHVRKLLPNERDREIMLAYMAAIVQHPGVKFQWAPVLQGTPGNGKTLLTRCVIEAIGRDYCHLPKAKDLGNRFNGWLEDKLFIGIEDITGEGKDAIENLEALKLMITSDWIEIERKGVNQRSVKVCANFIINCNPRGAVEKDRDDRRFAVMFTNQQSLADIVTSGMGGDYFPKLYRWLNSGGYAIVADYLATYPIPDELNPATHCHRSPITSSTEKAILASRGRAEQEVQEAIDGDRIGFRGGWVSGNYLAILLKELGISNRYTPQSRTALMENLGYIPHPGLPNGRTHNPPQPDGCRTVLYIKANGPHVTGCGAEVARRYSEAQQEASVRLALAPPPASTTA